VCLLYSSRENSDVFCGRDDSIRFSSNLSIAFISIPLALAPMRTWNESLVMKRVMLRKETKRIPAVMTATLGFFFIFCFSVLNLRGICLKKEDTLLNSLIDRIFYSSLP